MTPAPVLAVSTGTVLGIAIPIIVVLAIVAIVVTARRTDSRRGVGELSRETKRKDRSALPAAAPAPTGREVERAAAASRTGTALVPASQLPPAPYVPPDPEQLGTTRRHFLNIGLISLMGVGLAGFGAAVLAFLWPKLGGGFGSKITVGRVEDVEASIAANNGFFYLPEGRAWITHYPKEALPKAQAVYSGGVLQGMEAGFVALYQKCPHLGCRVPECVSSQWFECPCHGSQYNRVGEKKGGPAPRGMDHFPAAVTDGVLTVDTGQIVQGAPIGTNTTGQEAEGPHCVGGGGEH